MAMKSRFVRIVLIAALSIGAIGNVRMRAIWRETDGVSIHFTSSAKAKCMDTLFLSPWDWWNE